MHCLQIWLGHFFKNLNVNYFNNLYMKQATIDMVLILIVEVDVFICPTFKVNCSFL